MNTRGWIEGVAAMVARTCAEQGVPVKVTGQVTLAQVEVLLGDADAGSARTRAA